MRAQIGQEEEVLAVVHADGVEMQSNWLTLGKACVPHKLCGMHSFMTGLCNIMIQKCLGFIQTHYNAYYKTLVI